MTTAWVDLADMRDYLRFQPNDATDDDQLAGFINAACECIEDIKGHVAALTVDDFPVVERLGIVLLEERPVASVQTVAIVRADGTTVDVPKRDPLAGGLGWELRSAGGVLTVPLCGSVHARPGDTLHVGYTVGVTPIPARYIEATKELVAHLWQNSQLNTGGGRMNLGDEDTEYVRGMSGASYAMPFKVRELLGIYGNTVKSQVLAR